MPFMPAAGYGASQRFAATLQSAAAQRRYSRARLHHRRGRRLAFACPLGVRAAVARGDQHDRQQRADQREARRRRGRRARSPWSARAPASWLPRVQQVLGAAVGDRREDRQAERAADLLGGVDQARGEAGLVRARAGHRGDRHGTKDSPRPIAASIDGPEHVGGERAAVRRAPSRTRTGRRRRTAARVNSTGLKPKRVTPTEAAPAERMIATASGR